MKLTELYKLRKNFAIIGLTGRTGSGCTKVAEILSQDFNTLSNGIRNTESFKNPIITRKLEICKKYLSHGENWTPFEIIKYKNVLLFYIIGFIGFDETLLLDLFKQNYKDDKETDNEVVQKIVQEILQVLKSKSIVKGIISLKNNYQNIKIPEQLSNLNNLFWSSEFQDLSSKIFNILENDDYFKRSLFLHWISCNIRNSGDPINKSNVNDIKYIYKISELINRLIKARKFYNDGLNKPTKIVIDSLRNSLEIMFFKERYSAFYMIATKEGSHRNKEEVIKRLPNSLIPSVKEKIGQKLIDLDITEYQTNNYSKGKFGSPDVYNCIQKSEIHIVNYSNKSKLESEDFFTIQEQILKIISLILQPGIITPSARERCMQVAYNAKLNSGCISRQVGAVVTDSNYSIKAMGWNDVPHGQTPCLLRDANDYLSDPPLDKVHYSDFERGENIDSIDVDFKYKNKEPNNFPNAVKAYFYNKELSANNVDLEGKNCSFCFKTIHNYYESEKNQVHTKSLHAEENAMLQITKYGGQALNGGILFTTASPCELCSKKAMQLGIKKIYYIDPYPGISLPQILKYNRDYEMELISFIGAIGKSYNRLYEPFMAFKDELTIILENKPKQFENSHNNLFEKIENTELKSLLNNFVLDGKLDENKLLEKLK